MDITVSQSSGGGPEETYTFPVDAQLLSGLKAALLLGFVGGIPVGNLSDGVWWFRVERVGCAGLTLSIAWKMYITLSSWRSSLVRELRVSVLLMWECYNVLGFWIYCYEKERM